MLMAARFDLRLAQLVCSRLCHDLAGLTGAIANGADLVAESSAGVDAEALALIGQSARQANARIAFFRVAFGANAPAQTLADVVALAEGMLAGGPVRLAPLSGAPARARLAPDSVRLVLALVMVGAGSLSRGGTVQIEAAELADGIGVSLTATGAGAAVKPELAAALEGALAPETCSPREIHALWAGMLAGAMGGKVELAAGEGTVRLAVLLPRDRPLV
jgi:histidine phosphotransferase ChpT